MNLDDHSKNILDRVPVPEPAASQRLYQLGLGAVLFLAAWFIFQSGGDLGVHTLSGIGILVLAALPALRWAKQRQTWFPAFELFCLTCVPFYAVPLLTSHRDLDAFPGTVVGEAGFLILVFLGSASLGFSLLRNPIRPVRWASQSLLPPDIYRQLPVGLLLNTIYIYVTAFTNIIPYEFSGALRALFFGIGTLTTFVLAKLWGAGALNPRARGFFILNLSVQIVFLFSQLYLITGISLLALTLIAYTSARRRVPWIPVVAMLALLVVLHNGKSQMRAAYWEADRRVHPGDLPAFFSEWLKRGLSHDEKADPDDKHTSLLERASLIHMLCLSVDRVPELKPYLSGQSYIDIPAQVVPRFMWPNKPSSLLANVRLAIYFGLVDEISAMQVSIAFGMIAEAYVNFGGVGVAALGFGLGLLFRFFAMLSRDAPQFSAIGIFTILLTAWSFQAELVLATWLASLFQASVVCIGLPLLYRKLTHA